MKSLCDLRNNFGFGPEIVWKCLAIAAVGAYIFCGVLLTLGLIFLEELNFGSEAFLFLSGGLAGQAVLFLLWQKIRPDSSWFLLKISCLSIGCFGAKVFLDGCYALWSEGSSAVYYWLQTVAGVIVVMAAAFALNCIDEAVNETFDD